MQRTLISLISILLFSTLAVSQSLPPRVFAPYIDMAKATSTLEQIHAASGTKYFTLAFIISGKDCEPSWGGTSPVSSDTAIAKQIEELREAGGDVIIAFGGQAGKELGLTCPNAASLQAAYQIVVDKYKVKQLDLDVEGAAIEDNASIDRRNEAVTKLVAANPGLRISYTLPVFPNGLTPSAINVMKSAVARHAPIHVANLMTMDYGNPVDGDGMAKNAISAAKATIRQLNRIRSAAAVGITPMIGMNDSPGETFSLADAQAVLNFAKEQKQVTLLSFWSVSRDNGSTVGKVDPFGSGIAQKDWEFSQIFQKF